MKTNNNQEPDECVCGFPIADCVCGGECGSDCECYDKPDISVPVKPTKEALEYFKSIN
jgi:hypothetical protein